MPMDINEFKRLLEQGATARQIGKADWESIIAEAAADGGVYTIRQFYQKFVKGAVTLMRTRRKLDNFHTQGKAARVYLNGRYYYCFNPEVVQ